MSYESYLVRERPGKKLVIAEADAELGVALVHIHTSAVDNHGLMSPGEVIEKAMEMVGPNVPLTVVITDHNTQRGSDLARSYVGKHELENTITVPSGVEVTAQDADGSYGHILAIGVNGYIKPGQTPEATIDQIHEKGGRAVIAHPDLPHAQSLSWDAVKRLARRSQDAAPLGLEVFNASGQTFHTSPFTKWFFPQDTNFRARALFSSTPGLGAAVASLDAHDRRLDSAITLYRGESLMDSLLTGATIPVVNKEAFRLRTTSQDIFVMGMHRAAEIPRKVASRIL